MPLWEQYVAEHGQVGLKRLLPGKMGICDKSLQAKIMPALHFDIQIAV